MTERKSLEIFRRNGILNIKGDRDIMLFHLVLNGYDAEIVESESKGHTITVKILNEKKEKIGHLILYTF